MVTNGWYSPSEDRYWQTVGTPSEAIKASWPTDTIEVTIKPGSSYSYSYTSGDSDLTWSLSIDALIAAKAVEIDAKKAEIFDTGAPYTVDDVTYYIELDDSSRTDMDSMATTAIGVIAGAVTTWPDKYILGWITKSNVRIPLAEPATGLALAYSVGVYYSAVVQNARDLKDSAEACTTSDELDAIDITDGWPSETEVASTSTSDTDDTSDDTTTTDSTDDTSSSS